MSHYACEICGIVSYDTPKGYIRGCVHHPPDGAYKNKYNACEKCGGVSSDVIDCAAPGNSEHYCCQHCRMQEPHDL